MKLSRFIILAAALLLASCGPVYKTDYTFVPPQKESGRTCVAQCENSKLLCAQLAETQYTSCLQRAELRYQSCENRKIYRINYKNGKSECIDNCYCYRPSCTKDDSSCGAQYRSCYQTCGGKVTSRTYCTSGCEEVGGVGAAPRATVGQ